MRFDIDANGILSVIATDKGTGKKQDIKITGASTLPSDEVDRMVQDAEKNAEGACCSAIADMLCIGVPLGVLCSSPREDAAEGAPLAPLPAFHGPNQPTQNQPTCPACRGQEGARAD